MTAPGSFGDTLAERIAERSSQLVLGVDPDPRVLWPEALANPSGGLRPADAAAAAVGVHCRALIDAAAPACVAVKLQLARFELLGARGWALLQELAAYARAQGLLVIADGKRGDIDVSAAAYAAALFDGVQTPFGHVFGLEADLVTVNPLMGADAVAPFLAAARASGGGVLLLVRTSNVGARDLQDLPLAEGGALWERIAQMVDALGGEHVGALGFSDVGAVLGATEPQHLARARELMPHAPFLLPGVGAQGGSVQALAGVFAAGRAGGLVSASRSIADAYLSSGGEPREAARAAAEHLRDQAWALSETP